MTEKASAKERRKRAREIKKNRRRSSRKPLGEDMKLFGRQFREVIGGYDMTVVILVVVFALFGAAMVFSAGYYQTINTSHPSTTYYLFRQLFFVFTGLALMFIIANIDYHHYMKISNLVILASIVSLVLVMFVGKSANNAQRWIQVFGFRITPSEFSKIFVIVFTSCFLIRNPDNIRTLKGLGTLTVILGIHFFLIYKQPNLSTALVIAMIMIGIMVVAGLNLLLLLVPIGGGAALTWYILNFRQDSHWYHRFMSFMDPFADRQGDGYQVTQGLIALGNGGLKGLGFGKSIAKNMYLPEPQNDFILAIFGEELGYIGFVILMGFYIFLLFRLLLIAIRADDRLGLYLASGVAAMLGLQVIINVAVVTSSMPATGITLPFISYGGSSMWSFMMGMGIALNVSRKRKKTT